MSVAAPAVASKTKRFHWKRLLVWALILKGLLRVFQWTGTDN